MRKDKARVVTVLEVPNGTPIKIAAPFDHDSGIYGWVDTSIDPHSNLLTVRVFDSANQMIQRFYFQSSGWSRAGIGEY